LTIGAEWEYDWVVEKGSEVRRGSDAVVDGSGAAESLGVGGGAERGSESGAANKEGGDGDREGEEYRAISRGAAGGI
jgi:hypothetical protein